MADISFFKYGLSPLSLLLYDEVVKDDKAIFRENITAIVAFGRTTEISASFSESLYANKMTIPIGTVDKLSAAETVGNKTIAFLMSNDKSYFGEQISVKDALGIIFSSKAEYKENVTGKLAIGSQMSLDAKYKEDVTGKIGIGTIELLDGYYSENVGSMVSVINFITEILEITATIPPGSKITINSDDFSAWLNNNVNIIHLVDGDWLKLSRSTLHIEIEGAVEGNILYTSRWV